MAREVVASVWDSPAVSLLLALEADGFLVTLTPSDALRVMPKERLTPDRMAQITEHKDALKVLVRCCDEGVAMRRDVFRAQIEAETVGPLNATSHGCDLGGHYYSCGEPNNQTGSTSLCWRCALGWRLAARLPIPESLLVAVLRRVA